MPVPLGFWAVAGAGSGAAGPAMELIATTFGNGSSGTITFSSIPSTYKHLQVRYSVRASSSSQTGIGIYFNNDTANNYNNHRLYANNNFRASENPGVDSRVRFNTVAGDTSLGNTFGDGIVDILDYTATNKNKTVRTRAGFNDPNQGNSYTGLYSGAWFSTAAINQLTVIVDSGAMFSNSRVSLYGILG